VLTFNGTVAAGSRHIIALAKFDEAAFLKSIVILNPTPDKKPNIGQHPSIEYVIFGQGTAPLDGKDFRSEDDASFLFAARDGKGRKIISLRTNLPVNIPRHLLRRQIAKRMPNGKPTRLASPLSEKLAAARVIF
jgi:hypothetical protein